MPAFEKKSQGISFNVIIIAAVVLIVLIVLWSIFTGRIGSFGKELKECRGRCISADDCVYPTGTRAPEGDCENTGTDQATGTAWVSYDTGKVCCVMLQ